MRSAVEDVGPAAGVLPPAPVASKPLVGTQRLDVEQCRHLHAADGADGSRGDQVADRAVRFPEPLVITCRQHQPRFGGGGDHAVAVLKRRGHRFFDQHVLAAFCRQQCFVDVAVMRRTADDRVDVVPTDQLLDRFHAVDPVVLGQPRRPSASGHRHDLGTRCPPCRLNMSSPHEPRAGHTDSNQSLAHPRSSSLVDRNPVVVFTS